MPPDDNVPTSDKIQKSTADNIITLRVRERDYDSLFEHATWVYAFCREHLFRDDTKRIITALCPGGRPAPGTTLIELGCGPGFYSCRLGERFREMSITGVDRSGKQVQWANDRAEALQLSNCCFKRINALKLSCSEAVSDVVL